MHHSSFLLNISKRLRTAFCMEYLGQPIRLIHVIARAHASTRSISLMRVKNSTCQFCLWHLLFGPSEWRKWKDKNIKLNSWSFFFKLSLTWMLYFHAWLQRRKKIYFGVNTILSLAYINILVISLRTTAKQYL